MNLLGHVGVHYVGVFLVSGHASPDPGSDLGTLSQQQVCDRIEMDRSDMVWLIDDLEGRGHVRRTRDPRDRRRYQLTLPPRGRKALGRCNEILAQVTDDVFSALSADERRTLHRLTLRALGQPAEIADLLDTPSSTIPE